MNTQSAPGFAIIGMACRLPGAVDWRTYWRNICDGLESVSFFSEQELLAAGVDPALLRDPDYVRTGFLLPEPENFDAAFFGYSPLQARLIDPQHRLMLETAWETFEDAGHVPGQTPGPVGVYATTGSIVTSYLMNALNDHPDSHGNTGSLIHFGNDKDFAGTRVSFKLDLRGPSVNVQTACSSSLTLIHLACQAIRNGECKLAVVLGATMRVPHAAGYLAIKGGIMSPDGHVRTFDADAKGTVFSSGTAGVLLKELTQAIADGDHIYAVVRGSAVNNDGARKKSYASPSAAGQAEAIKAALDHANAHPASIGYVECHGTGTFVGDPVEVEALTQAFGDIGTRKTPCLIGSVKPNIGHSEQSAGLASLIKTALAVSQGMIPGTINFATPNPRIDFAKAGFAKSGFEVLTHLTPWLDDGQPRRALVNGLGVGGTNAAVVVEQAPQTAPRASTQDRPAHVFVLSAKSAKALEQTAMRHLAWLQTNATQAAQPDTLLGDICYTLAAGRSHFEYRFTSVVGSLSELSTNLANGLSVGLSADLKKPSPDASAEPLPRKIAFLYSGQGAQTVGMGQQLYLSSKPFREALNRVAEAMQAYLDRPLLEVLGIATNPVGNSARNSAGNSAGNSITPSVANAKPGAEALIDQTRYTQPALFAVEVALAEVLGTWGIVPDAVIGHSVGEFAAAYLAGVYTLPQAARLICERGRLMQALPAGGGMIAVLAGEAAVQSVLAALKLHANEQAPVIAAINSAEGCVISGSLQALEKAASLFKQRDIVSRPLAVSHAFHSGLMAPMLDSLRQIASEVVVQTPAQAPTVRWISTLHGKAMSSAPTPDYWCQQARGAVRFADAVQALIAEGITDFIEIGPGKGLLTHLLNSLPKNASALPSLGKGQEWRNMLETLARLYGLGHAINWAGLDAPYARHRLSLPTYAFERQRIWPDEAEAGSHSASANAGTAAPTSVSKIKAANLNAQSNTPIGMEGNWAGSRLPSPLPAQQYESVYSRSNLAWLDDHRIHGAVVLPVTAGLMAVWSAVSRQFDQAELEIRDFTQDAPMVLGDDEERLCHLLLDPAPASASDRHFSIASTESNLGLGADNAWLAHMQGKIRVRPLAKNTANPTNPINPIRFEADAVRQRCPQTVVAERYYAILKRLGLSFGPAFHGLQSLWRGTGEALARVRLPDRIVAQIGIKDSLHPALLGACLQMYPAVIEALGDFSQNPPPGSLVFVPLAIERCVFTASTARELWVHVRLRQQTGLIDLDAWDVEGHNIARFEGISVGSLPASVFRVQSKLDNWLYKMQWEACALPVAVANRGSQTSWLILGGDQDGTAAALKTALAEYGASCNILPVSEVPDTPAQFAQFAHLLEALAKQADGKRVEIVDCAGIDLAQSAQSASSLQSSQPFHWADPAYQQRAYGRVMALARALLAGRDKFSAAPRLWLLTRNAAAVLATDPPVDVLAAGLWGLGRSLALEIPTLWAGLVDLQANTAPAAQAQLLAAQLLCADAENQIALRNGQRQTLRLLPCALPVQRTQQVVAASATSASWLITGGLGGLGLQVARWLAKNRRSPTLVLVSRQGIHAANAQQAKQELEALGARVLILMADVGTEADVISLMAQMAQLQQNGPKLAGIYHTAGVRADALLEQMDWPKFRQVLAPKLDAAWFLHQHSQAFELQEFVLFSSMMSLFGSTGQTNYTTANACLDALAQHRKSLGLPALTVNWGPWAGEGMAASMGEQGEALWRNRGVHFISPELGQTMFDVLFNADPLAEKSVNAGVGLVDWSIFLRQFSVTPPLYKQLQTTQLQTAGTESQSGSRLTDDLRVAMASGDASVRRHAITTFLCHQAMILLGLAEPADPKRALHELGLDSMMSIELINCVDAAIGVRIPMARLITGPAIHDLVDQVWPDTLGMGKLAAESTANPNNPTSPTNPTQPHAQLPPSAKQTNSGHGAWMVRVVPCEKPRFRVFCFPYAGGGSATFQNWGADLEAGIEVIAVEPPGRLARINERPLTDMSTFVHAVVAAMRPLMDVPFAFFGHCLGSLTSYEVARHLVNQHGPRPCHLFCSGARPPDRIDFIGPFERSLARRLSSIPGYVRGMPPYQQPDAVFGEIIRHFDMAAMEQLLGDPELRRLMLPVVRAEFEMASNYRFRQERPWDIPITCFIAKGDSYVSRQDILSWGRFTNNRMQVFMREGTHYSIHEDAAFFQRVISRELTAPPI